MQARIFVRQVEYPLRAWLYLLDEQDHILVREIHQIASDFGSTQILKHELTDLYTACRAGDAPEIEPLPVQYADYALRQQDNPKSESSQAHLDYWRSKLADPTLPDLPTDFPRPAEQTFSGAACTRTLPANLVRELQQIGELADLLGLVEAGREANFFELGGNSLLAIRLFAILEERYGCGDDGGEARGGRPRGAAGGPLPAGGLLLWWRGGV